MINCIICKSSSIVDYNKAGNNYQLKRCPNCDLVFDTKTPSNNKNLYEQEYYISQNIKGGYFNYFEESVVNKLTFKYRLNKIENYIKSKKVKLLDMGCAIGHFLEVARELLWEDIYGTEVSSFAVKECRNKGLAVYKIGLKGGADKILRADSFDVITLQDVIEHFAYPTVEIKRIYNYLKPEGLLFMTTPDIGSFSAKIMGNYWYHYKKGEHLYYFNKKNISKMLRELGFIDIKVNPTLSWVTIKYLVNRLIYYLPKKYFKLINFFTTNPLCQIAFPIYTGEMEIWAKKPSSK